MIDKNSDVTLVLTSCGRFDLLKVTLDSFVKHNDYPIRRLILTEDSGDQSVHDVIPEELREDALVFVNNPKLGQIRSIDLAYSHVDTKYIMHCEDDWQFFRPGFMAESKRILESDSKVLHIRMHKHDFKSSPNIQLTNRQQVDNIAFYDNAGKYKGLSWNPGLRRLADYTDMGSFESMSSSKDTFIDVEARASEYYQAAGFRVVFLESYVVKHIGDDDHVLMPGENRKKFINRARRLSKNVALVLLGYLISQFTL